jgi:predicted methyltransferase
MRLKHFAPLAALLLSAPLLAKPADYAPAVADAARIAGNRALDEGRMPAETLDFAGIKRGDIVADFQAGGGYYTEIISRVVGPKGRVYALTQPNFYKAEVWDKLTASHPNVLPLVARGDMFQLAPRSVDVIFTHLVYHDLYWTSEKYQHPRLDVPVVLAGWFSAVKPGGHVIIADHTGPTGDPRAVVDQFHRIDPAQVKADMAAAGFVLEGESNLLQRSEDLHDKNVFDPAIRGKTDRFLLKFKRP